MKKITIIIFLLSSFITSSQNVNHNLYKKGDRWGNRGVNFPTGTDLSRLNQIPSLIMSQDALNAVLPEVVYNDTNDFWPGIAYQGVNNSCSQFAGIYYTYTYEINRLRNLNIDSYSRVYSHYYTWNFLNQGYNEGSMANDGWDIVKENGCPNIETWGVNETSKTKWMSGYEKYYQAESNKIESQFSIDVSDENGIDELKHWLYNHGEVNSATGGLVVFYGETNGYVSGTLQPGSTNVGDKIVVNFFIGDTTGHAMTVVGYDDNVMYDLNQDGVIQNGSSVEDWEIGAFKVANSLGIGWQNQGFIWVPYSLFAKNDSIGGIWFNKVYGIHAQESYEPMIMFKTSVTHDTRYKLKYKIGYGNNAASINPSSMSELKTFNNQGGDHPMQGFQASNTLENGLDFSEVYPGVNFGKLFLDVEEDTNSMGGSINSFSIIDYRFGEVFELECPLTNYPINQGSNILAIEYDLLPFDMHSNVTYSTNKVVRLNPVISNNSTVTIAAGTKLDLYNSNITIEEGSTLILGDNVQIESKSGDNEIIIFGELIIGNNVTFKGHSTSNITIKPVNINKDLEINNASMYDGMIKGFTKKMKISGCYFENIYIENTSGNFDIQNNTFSNVHLSSIRPTSKCSKATIKDNIINNGSFFPYDQTILISDFGDFEIMDNTVYFQSGDGLSIQYSGSNCGQNIIKGNTITGSQQSSTLSYGLDIQRSIVNIQDNLIEGAKYGILCADNSAITILGNSSAITENETQRIKNNSTSQVYITDSNFPTQFEYNAIYGGSYTIRYLGNQSGPFDVENNNWNGMSNQQIENSLYPSASSYYDYQPIWNYGNKSATEDEVLALYEEAISYIHYEKYELARNTFKEIVWTYPNSEFATASLNQILSIERLDQENFDELKSFYLSDETIQSYTPLLEVSKDLANWCDVYAKNYEVAISYFEELILNSEDLNEVIYAEIDLAYTYMLMENEENKYVGNILGIKPDSFTSFQNRRFELIKKLSEDSRVPIIETNNKGKNNEIEVYPNPSYGEVTFSIKTQTLRKLKIDIYDIDGRFIECVCDFQSSQGIQSRNIVWYNENQRKGLYVYRVEADNQTYEGRFVLL